MPTSSKRPGYTPADPFRPVAATPVDLFPHTAHGEIVVLFERVPFDAPAVDAAGPPPLPAAIPSEE